MEPLPKKPMEPLATPGDEAPDVLAGATEAIHEWRMFDRVSRLGVGLSGGADSLALLDTLVRYAGSCAEAPELIPIHIHQYPSTQNAERLGEFVATRYGLQLHIARVDTTARARRLVVAGKAPCRACAPVRAKALAVECRKHGVDALALGHHLDDALATLIMNIFHRGSIDTMRPVAKRRQDPGLPLLRPFIFLREAFVKANSPVGPEGLFDCGMCSLHARERRQITALVSDLLAQHQPAASHAEVALRTLFPGPR